MDLITWLLARMNTMRCDGCGHRFHRLYRHHGDLRCNPCIARRVRMQITLERLERDGILKIVRP